MEDGIWQYRFIDEAITYAELAAFKVVAVGAHLVAYRPDMKLGSEFFLIDESHNGQDRYVWKR